MKYNKLLIVAVVCILAIVGFLGWKLLKPSKAPAKADAPSAEVQNDASNSDKPAPSARKFNFQSFFGMGDANKPEEEVVAEAEAQAPDSPLANLFDDPKMRDELTKQMHIQADQLYSDFVHDLDLDSQTEAKLKDLLFNRLNAGADIGIAMVTGQKLSPEEMKQKQDDLARAKEESDRDIANLLGERGSQQFKDYEEMLPEHQQLKQMAREFEAKGAGFDQGQERLMAEFMHDARTKSAADFPNNFDPSKMAGGDFKQAVTQMQKEFDYVASQARASGRFSQTQLDVLVAGQKQQIENLKNAVGAMGARQ